MKEDITLVFIGELITVVGRRTGVSGDSLDAEDRKRRASSTEVKRFSCLRGDHAVSEDLGDPMPRVQRLQGKGCLCRSL